MCFQSGREPLARRRSLRKSGGDAHPTCLAMTKLAMREVTTPSKHSRLTVPVIASVGAIRAVGMVAIAIVAVDGSVGL